MGPARVSPIVSAKNVAMMVAAEAAVDAVSEKPALGMVSVKKRAALAYRIVMAKSVVRTDAQAVVALVSRRHSAVILSFVSPPPAYPIVPANPAARMAAAVCAACAKRVRNATPVGSANPIRTTPVEMPEMALHPMLEMYRQRAAMHARTGTS